VKASRFARVYYLAQRPELMSGAPEAIPEALKAAGLYAASTKATDIALGLPGLLREARRVIAGASYPPPQREKTARTAERLDLEELRAELTALQCRLTCLEDRLSPGPGA
jgi:hypothetical protein